MHRDPQGTVAAAVSPDEPERTSVICPASSGLPGSFGREAASRQTWIDAHGGHHVLLEPLHGFAELLVRQAPETNGQV